MGVSARKLPHEKFHEGPPDWLGVFCLVLFLSMPAFFWSCAPKPRPPETKVVKDRYSEIVPTLLSASTGYFVVAEDGDRIWVTREEWEQAAPGKALTSPRWSRPRNP